uniref:Rad21/Rec8-like protein N-terminal domain-containing protein n=1 Tax=Caenorhabditis japonica TaxID=281687 RepID=A0A8R1HHQ9_CAEJA
MFYAQFVLAKKGPLAKIWLAAHWEKKLTKAQIYETDVSQAIEEVIRPKVKMALRTVGHLLLGIVRIYSKKARYLLQDTNEAYLKMKVNFRGGFTFEADLPLDAEFDEDFDNFVEDVNITVPEFRDADYNEQLIMANVSRLEDITLKEDCNFNAMFGGVNEAVGDDGFGDEGEYAELAKMYGSIEPSSIRPTPQPESFAEGEAARAGTAHASRISIERGADSVILLDGSRGLDSVPNDEFGGGARENFNIKLENETLQDDYPIDMNGPDFTVGNLNPPAMFSSMIHAPHADEIMDFDGPADNTITAPPEPEPHQLSPESFALEPLNLDQIEGKKKRQRKPRKLLVDSETMISDEAFHAQQEDYSDTLRSIQVAPPTRLMLELCVSGQLSNLMKNPGSEIRNQDLIQEYRRGLVPNRFDPNFTVQELSESSSVSASMDRQPAPWEDLELNDHIELGDGQEPPVEHDDFFDDIDMGEDYAPQMDIDAERTLVLDQNASGAIDPVFDEINAPQSPPRADHGELQNKENEEEEWSDPFGSSISSRRGRLEDYGFGSSANRNTSRDDDGKWAKRSKHILKKISDNIEVHGYADFSTVTSSAKNRKQAAEQFYSLLSLAKSRAVSVEQAEPYGEIVIRAGEKFKEGQEELLHHSPIGTLPTFTRTPMRPV